MNTGHVSGVDSQCTGHQGGATEGGVGSYDLPASGTAEEEPGQRRGPRAAGGELHSLGNNGAVYKHLVHGRPASPPGIYSEKPNHACTACKQVHSRFFRGNAGLHAGSQGGRMRRQLCSPVA